MNKGNRFLIAGFVAFLAVGGFFVARTAVLPRLGDGRPGAGSSAMVVRSLEVPYPADTVSGEAVTELDLEFAAGSLTLMPMDDSDSSPLLLKGNLEYNSAAGFPDVEVDDSRVSVAPAYRHGNAETRNSWDLEIGLKPVEMEMTLGASRGTVDLGGVRLQELKIDQGAGDYRFDFSRPNPDLCRSIKMDGGASRCEVTGIANSGTARFSYSGGAGFTLLDFSGDQQQDMDVDVNTGVSRTEILHPRGASISIEADVSLGSLEVNSDFDRVDDDRYEWQGEGEFALDIRIESGLGSVSVDFADAPAAE